MGYRAELQKFVTSQYIHFGIRITVAGVLPAVILAHFGLLRSYFLFPLAAVFMGVTDQPGPFIRRRNSLILAMISFFLVALTAALAKNIPALVFPTILVLGMGLTMLGVYGNRLNSVGVMSLIVMSIFIGSPLVGHDIVRSLLTFTAGSLWFIFVFLLIHSLQPYKLASQMIGENYLELSEFLKIKARFYLPNPDFDKLLGQLLTHQIAIKNLQENTRETVFRTRTIIQEATTTSRLLMMMFLNTIDLHEKLLTSESDYIKIQESFSKSDLLKRIHDYLLTLADEIKNIGIALQSGTKARPIAGYEEQLRLLYGYYFSFRNENMNAENLENFMVMKQILIRISETTDVVTNIYSIFSQDISMAKSLSTGLDYAKFLPKEPKLNFKVYLSNFSLSSQQFRHSVRITLALLLGYAFSFADFIGVGHTYWILITIIAIMKPAYSITKSRNLLRVYGTVCGGIAAYLILYFIHDEIVLLILLLASMVLCYTFLRNKYFIAVFFMTMYIFLMFNFVNPGHVNTIFKDRLLDTFVGGVVAFAISYLVLPVWEHTQNIEYMKKTNSSNLKYFETVMMFLKTSTYDDQKYRLRRKDAIIALANLSDNFQRMISDPKEQRSKLETVHQFVNTAHLITAYTASLSQYAKSGKPYRDIDFDNWQKKITAELTRTSFILKNQKYDEKFLKESHLIPEDFVSSLLEKRKQELEGKEFRQEHDMTYISYAGEIKNINELLILIYNTSREQRKSVENYYKTKPALAPEKS